TSIPSTTSDTTNTHFKGFGYDLMLIDTAGIRKKRKVEENVEYYSVVRSIRAIENSDVCMLMIDAEEGINKQDLNILDKIVENNKGVVILINKWDLIEKDTKTADRYREFILDKIQPFSDVPIIFTSVKDKKRLLKGLDTALEVHNNRKRKITTSHLNKTILEHVKSHPSSMYKGRDIKIKFMTQLPTYFPSFALYCNYPDYVKASYKRYVENKIREHYDFNGVPIRVFFREK
ncbi:MAG: GTP-binding protein, partial [Flavobacteriales bacterium]